MRKKITISLLISAIIIIGLPSYILSFEPDKQLGIIYFSLAHKNYYQDFDYQKAQNNLEKALKHYPQYPLSIELDKQLDSYSGRTIKLSDIQTPKKQGNYWHDYGNHRITEKGLTVRLDQTYFSQKIEISSDSDDDYRIFFYKNNKNIAESLLEATSRESIGLVIHQINTPKKAVLKGFNKLIIKPEQGNSEYSIGHITLL